MNNFLLGCDWGTSSFRLRLLDVSHDKVVGEVVSDVGIANMYQTWQKSNEENKTIGKEQLFRKYLKKELEELSTHTSVNLDNVTILISGMASSSIGMEDIPYAKVPYPVDGSGAVVKHYSAIDNFPHEIVLISGVRSGNDVMRGEETQLIGLFSLLKATGNIPKEGVFIFPGTHSKHIYVENGQLTKFQTFMTGEIFNIIRQHSILNASLEKQEEKKLSEADIDAFKLGVKKSKEARLLNGLFTVRTNQLFEKLDKKQNYLYLSGLLIGEEMNYLLKEEELNLYLCSGSNLKDYYSMAIEELGLTSRTTIVPGAMVDKAALTGQQMIFQKQQSKSN